MALLSRLFDWRDALVVVRPETLIRWHRAGWRLFWRIKSRPGRPRIPLELRQLIRRMASENPLWGEERIANELLLKLGLRVSPRTVRKYMPKRPPGRPRGDPRWAIFLREVVGFDRAQVAAAQPQGLCDLRTGDRNGSTRVPGLVDPAVGDAPAIDPEGMGGSLQPWTPARCWVACITNICWRPRCRDRVIAEHRTLQARQGLLRDCLGRSDCGRPRWQRDMQYQVALLRKEFRGAIGIRVHERILAELGQRNRTLAPIA